MSSSLACFEVVHSLMRQMEVREGSLGVKAAVTLCCSNVRLCILSALIRLSGSEVLEEKEQRETLTLGL
jgi:hypothetical protein